MTSSMPETLDQPTKDGQPSTDKWAEHDSGFGIPTGSLNLVELKRSEWRYPMTIPLPPPSPVDAPILQEFSRPWKVLRLPFLSASNHDTEGSLMKSYEPQYTPSEPTFASQIHTSSILEPRVAIPEAQAFLITPRIRFLLGTVESLTCRLVMYDMSLGCRATEEICFQIPGPMLDESDATAPPAVLLHVLPTLQMQNLYLLLKVSKVLVGDADIATAPYCTPDKFASTSEQQKLVEKAVDCRLRLGRFQQPLAWGIMPLSKGIKRPMTLYRQRGCISEEQRISMISDAIRGLFKEKAIPALCEFDFNAISAEEFANAKFKSPETSGPYPLPQLKIFDPFSERGQFTSNLRGQFTSNLRGQFTSNLTSKETTATDVDTVTVCCEVQPFCTSSLIPKFGITGSGPVAVSYVNTLYVYPHQLERCLFRNIAIRVQLLQKEVDAVRGDEIIDEAVLRAVYRAQNHVSCSAYALVGYHQKNPQYDDEIKICLPECLTLDHHLLFTFFHVHCKKLQPSQPQQEIVGYAVMPILEKDETIMQDGKFAVNVIPAPISTKSSASGVVPLCNGYVAAAREATLDNTKTVFTCRGRVVSSIHSQDSAVAAFLNPFHSSRRFDYNSKEETILARLLGLNQSNAVNVRYFFFIIAKFVLGYLRYGTSIVRWSAFRTLLAIMEKTSWNPRGSLKIHEMNRVLHDFVHFVFDETSIEDPHGLQPLIKNVAKSDRNSVYSALLETWLNVLSNKASADENADTKRMSLMYSNVLLQLILKSMAMSLLDQGTSLGDNATNSLPMILDQNGEVMLERLLNQLVACASDTTNGLLLQKEINRSVAYFCRGAFLVVKNAFSARVIDRYIEKIDVQGDANSLRHIWLPFLHILVDFEFFPTVNGAIEENTGKARAWLAKAVSETLLLIIDSQSEQKIRIDSVQLLRRMFATQVYNPRFQSSKHQERIALLYYPLFPRFAQFTTPGKLLSKNSLTFGDRASGYSNAERKSVSILQKEMMACIGHLLCSVSNSQLPLFFQPDKDQVSTQEREVRVDETEALVYYHCIVKKHIFKDVSNNEAVANYCESKCDDQVLAYDESRVHASLVLIQRLLEIFLSLDSSNTTKEQLWCQLLSPDLSASDNETGLSLLENRLANRHGLHRRAGGGLEFSVKAIPADKVSETIQNATDRDKSLPRNRIKQNSISQQRQAVFSTGLEEKGALAITDDKLKGDHEEEIAALQHAVAQSALRVLQTAVNRYENVIRLIEVVYKPRLGKSICPNTADDVAVKAISINQAFVLLGFITELLFQLLHRSSSIKYLVGDLEHEIETQMEHQIDDHKTSGKHDTETCFVSTLLQYLQLFVSRFAVALFAVRIPGLPRPYDQCWLQLTMTIAATARKASMRYHAAMLISQLLTVCYEQTGSFLLVKAPILKVLTASFFPSSSKLLASTISTTSIRDLLDKMRTLATNLCGSVISLPPSFHLQFLELLNDLTTKVHTFDRWHSAFQDPDGAHDVEEIEEGIDRVIQDISPHWLLEEKLIWINALLRLHLRRNAFAEAVCCKMMAIECVQQTKLDNDPSSSSYLTRIRQWIVRELFVARGYAERANWIEKELSICERLLVHLKQQRRFHEYQDMLRCIDALVGKLVERQDPGGGQHNNSTFSFYRVRYAGGCVSALITKNEFIYKRGKFVSLGEFVIEMKSMLHTKYPQCERVDVVLEPKPLVSSESNPNVIFLRVTTVEEAHAEELLHLNATNLQSSNWQVAFKFAVPFTRGSSSAYGKTSEQMKRITYLSVTRAFPCHLHRQRVCVRHEELRSPIENSMDDIHKRCGLLRAEIDKESVGKTDLKTLTMVLKGSVDTHVHGGIPEILESFLADNSSHLVNAEGRNLSSHDSLQKRHELANLLVEFAQLCWQCLLISREAFRRSSQPNSPHISVPVALMSTEIFLPHHFDLDQVDATNETFLPPPLPDIDLFSSKEPVSPPPETETSPLSSARVSPLQTEFERSFASIVDQLMTQISFKYKNVANLARLQQQTIGLNVPPSFSAPAPVVPVSDHIH